MNISPNEPVWLTLDDILESHEEQLSRFGGSSGVRDIGLIESALERPHQLFQYEGETDTLVLAVRLGVGLAQNHGFVDGNKRVGAVAMIEFLMLNGYALDMPNDTLLGELFQAAVIRSISENELVEALFPHVVASEA